MRRLLVANRGEIAVRVIRAARSAGITTVAVYSDADRTAEHVRLADHAVRIGPTPARDSYLDGERILAAARDSGADAIHPGYGFLSENADFADACAAAGVTFVGPSGDSMRALGDKVRAKQVAARAAVPTVPTWDVDALPDDAFPVLVKASAGGGGRGMRVVADRTALADAIESARREAAAGFGDDTLLVEKLVTGARHIEVQLLADGHGTVLHIGDRDCSLQRRHQKVIEEAPAPGLSDDMHRALGEAAVRLAVEAGYVGAGTAEFLVTPGGEFYFLEINARLQVEHPVTELAFDIDLVRWQLRIADGERLTLTQEDVVAVRHAIEARLCAEDPIEYLPTGGRVGGGLALPGGRGVRVDHALREGLDIPLAYDSLIAKVIASGETRDEARRRLLDALADTFVPGVVTNGALLVHCLELGEFVEAAHTVESLARHPLAAEAMVPPADIVAGARRRQHSRDEHDAFAAPTTGERTPQFVRSVGDRLWIGDGGHTWDIPRATIDRGSSAGPGGGTGDRAVLVAPMPGTIITTLPAGTRVTAGDAVVVVEAMKMENAITSPFDGIVEGIAFEVGTTVTRGATLAEVVREQSTAEPEIIETTPA